MECLNCNSPRLKYDKMADAYVCLDCKYKFPKQYFFISHSHLDIEKVRIIRNIIEETFFYEPILFFLKCLSDEDELQSLIRREINERIWFVYCKSKNAENSKYVCQEREYLRQLKAGGKRFNELTIELDKFDIWDKECHDYVRNQVVYNIRKTKPFVCYAKQDKEVAQALIYDLQYRGFSVWSTAPTAPFADFGESIKSKIKEHSYRDGCIMLIVSEHSINSDIIQSELSYATAQNAFIVPILCAERNDATQLRQRLIEKFPTFANMQYLTFDTSEPYESAQRVFNQLSELQPEN